MFSPPSAPHQRLAIEAELAAGPCRFVRERLRLPMGVEASFGWLRHPPSVLVVPRLADGRLLLLRRYRPAVGRWVLEFPASPLEPGESPAAGGERLVRRLTGHGGGPWRVLGELRPNPGYSDERMTLGWMEVEVEGKPGPMAGQGAGGVPSAGVEEVPGAVVGEGKGEGEEGGAAVRAGEGRGQGEEGEGVTGWRSCDSAEDADVQRRFCTPRAVEAALSALEEPVDGRSVSAWFLARRVGAV